jgi:hypothetical protein
VPDFVVTRPCGAFPSEEVWLVGKKFALAALGCAAVGAGLGYWLYRSFDGALDHLNSG